MKSLFPLLLRTWTVRFVCGLVILSYACSVQLCLIMSKFHSWAAVVMNSFSATCARARERVYVWVCVRARVCVCVCVWCVTQLKRPYAIYYITIIGNESKWSVMNYVIAARRFQNRQYYSNLRKRLRHLVTYRRLQKTGFVNLATPTDVTTSRPISTVFP